MKKVSMPERLSLSGLTLASWFYGRDDRTPHYKFLGKGFGSSDVERLVSTADKHGFVNVEGLCSSRVINEYGFSEGRAQIKTLTYSDKGILGYELPLRKYLELGKPRELKRKDMPAGRYSRT
ncbi:MAG: hypothetical protein AABX35_01560 [Nanoarchaeota archaeon]